MPYKRFWVIQSSLFLVLSFSISAVSISAQQKSSDKNKSQTNPCNESNNSGRISPGEMGLNRSGLAADVGFSKAPRTEPTKTFSSDIKPLQIKSKPIAKHTEEARQNCIQGTVTLWITFLASGEIGRIKVLKGLGYGLSDRAIEAAKLIKFEPEIRRNKTVSVTKKVRYSFYIY